MSQNWMTQTAHSTFNDYTPISKLSIPGTHDSGTALLSTTSSFVNWFRNAIQCQEHDISTQLNMGIRFLDIRLASDPDFTVVHDAPFSSVSWFDCVCCHMINAQKTHLTFRAVVDKCDSFLTTNPGETIIMCIKASNSAVTSEIQRMIRYVVSNNQNLFYTGATIPLLGAVRGKIVLIHRFPPLTGTPLGIDFSTWDARSNTANAEGVFDLPNEATPVGKIQDKFNMYHWIEWSSKINEKIAFFNNSNAVFQNTTATATPPLCLNFSSCTMYGYVRRLANNINVTINSNATLHGCVIMDFPDQALINKIIASN